MADASFLAVIGDVVGSRDETAQERKLLQEQVSALLGELNASLGPTLLAAPVVQTAGDEIQALFRTAEGPLELIQSLTDRLHGRATPPIAFGLGWGAIFTHEVPPAPHQLENVAVVDGPAFHHARAALERVQAEQEWAACRGLGDDGDLIVSYLFRSMWSIRSRWTALQSWRSVGMRELGVRKAADVRGLGVQKEVARIQGVSPSVVSEALKAASFETVLAGEEATRRALACFTGASRP